jgi:hypothetical protein
MAVRTRWSTPRTVSGCDAMYSSTDLKLVLAILIPMLAFATPVLKLPTRVSFVNYVWTIYGAI